MSHVQTLAQLAQLEPWRQGHGLPRNALDPTWEPSPADLPCRGEIIWEVETAWWFCRQCGYIGNTSFTRHRPIPRPLIFFLQSLKLHLHRRMGAPGTTLGRVIGQMLFVAGTALRYSAVLPGRELGSYVSRMVIR